MLNASKNSLSCFEFIFDDFGGFLATLLEPREAALLHGPFPLRCSALPEVEGDFALLVETTFLVAVKVDLAALGGATSFPIWPCGRFQLAELTNLVGADMKKSMRDGYGSQQAELTCFSCSLDVTAAIDWPCPPPLWQSLP